MNVISRPVEGKEENGEGSSASQVLLSFFSMEDCIVDRNGKTDVFAWSFL